MSQKTTFDAVAEPAALDQVVEFVASCVVHPIKREPVNRCMLGRPKHSFELRYFVVGSSVAVDIVPKSNELLCGATAVSAFVGGL